jgi:hypothetical protein
MRLLSILLPLLALAPLLSTAAPTADDKSLFVEQLYPTFITAQCNLCHNDNGVASGTRFEFPPEGASEEQIYAFGLRLAEVVRSRLAGDVDALHEADQPVQASRGRAHQAGQR